MKWTLKNWQTQLEAQARFLPSPAPERIREILHRLDVTPDFKIISLAGTNGKGTTAHLIAAYYQKQGFKIGLFSSPHLLKFNERIQINGKNISTPLLVSILNRIEEVKKDIPLSYFDYSLLIALLFFKDQKIDLACVEAGLGGRLDAINALDADLSIITSIDLDHCAQLGKTREAIGREKAGIMRPHQICIMGDPRPVQSIQKQAQKTKAILYQAGIDFKIQAQNKKWSLKLQQQKSLGPFALPKHLPLQNAATALAAIFYFSGKNVQVQSFNSLLKTLKVPGRMQILHQRPLILIDVAHNPEAARYLKQRLDQEKHKGKTYMIFSALEDKDIKGMIEPFREGVEKWYLYPLPQPRAASKAHLKKYFSKHQASWDLIKDLKKELKKITQTLQAQDRLIIFGSFVLIGKILEIKLLHKQFSLAKMDS